MRIAVLVPAADYPLPWRSEYEEEAAVLSAAGIDVEPVRWTEASDLTGFDLVLSLLSWGYHLRYEQWLDFLERCEAARVPMINPPTLLRWNSDKAYLAQLADAGIATVPTIAVEQCCDEDLEEARRHFGADWLVIKPPVSATATGTFRLGRNDSLPRESHGRPMILQPFVEEIQNGGEFSLLLFDGELSHAVVKRPKSGDFRVQTQFGGETLPSPAPPGAELLAQAALAAAPARATYARVDIVYDDDGELRIMELELIEPQLFLDYAPDHGAAFARSILDAVQRSLKQPLA